MFSENVYCLMSDKRFLCDHQMNLLILAQKTISKTNRIESAGRNMAIINLFVFDFVMFVIRQHMFVQYSFLRDTERVFVIYICNIININLKKIVMKTIKFLSRIIIVLLWCYAANSCKKDKDSDDPAGPNSAFWSDGYRQHQLNGKVKTVKEVAEWEQSSGDFDLLEYNDQGCLIKDHSCRSDGRFGGLTLSYDNQNRLTKVIYGSASTPIVEVAEFGYNGAHNKYIPTNIYSMEDLRLQRGVTSVRYQSYDDDPMVVNYKSGSGNQIIFEGNVGGIRMLEREFGSKEIKMIVDCNADYPTHIKIQNPSGGGTEAFVKFGNDGMPSEVAYHSTGDMVVTTKFTTIKGFLLMTSQERFEDGSTYVNNKYTYNDKGYVETKDDNYRYSYEYDNQGNWTKRTCERFDGSKWEPYSYYNAVREYTYW